MPHLWVAAAGIWPRCSHCPGRWPGPSPCPGLPSSWESPGTRRWPSSSAQQISAPGKLDHVIKAFLTSLNLGEGRFYEDFFESWVMSLNFMTRTFFTSLNLEGAIILARYNDHHHFLKEELTFKGKNILFDVNVVLTWLCFTMALLSSMRPDKWPPISAEWILLSARVLASSLRRKYSQTSCLLNTAWAWDNEWWYLVTEMRVEIMQ